jgi:hypothetical protein
MGKVLLNKKIIILKYFGKEYVWKDLKVVWVDAPQDDHEDLESLINAIQQKRAKNSDKSSVQVEVNLGNSIGIIFFYLFIKGELYLPFMCDCFKKLKKHPQFFLSRK